MNKQKLSALLSDYGMILVLLILCIVFTFTTFKEQPAEGYGAGQNLAAKVAGLEEVILVVTKTNADTQLKDGFVESLQKKLIQKTTEVNE